jgi:hypothetical protein
VLGPRSSFLDEERKQVARELDATNPAGDSQMTRPLPAELARKPIQFRTHSLLLESLSVHEIDCRCRAAVVINQSPPIVSAKREYSRTRPETFGGFNLKIGELAAWRRKRMREKAGILAFLGEPRRTHEWLAGDAVPIAPVSSQFPC